MLRLQLIVVRRRLQDRVRLTNPDRWFFIQLYRWFPSILQVLTIVRPETLVRWHRAGFRYYRRWKSRRRAGRPQIDTDLRALIRLMSTENLLWGAPRIARNRKARCFLSLRCVLLSHASRALSNGSPPNKSDCLEERRAIFSEWAKRDFIKETNDEGGQPLRELHRDG